MPQSKHSVDPHILKSKQKDCNYECNFQPPFYNLVKEVNPEVDRATFEDGLSSKKGQAHFIHPLLGAAHLGAALMNARTSQRNDFTSEIVNVMGAKTNDSSAYTKASA